MNAMTPTIGDKTHFDTADRRWSELKADRSWHEQCWEDIARLFRPQRGGFSLNDPSKRQFEKPLSSAPIHAQSNFAAGLYGTLTNPANRWFGMKTNDKEMNHWQPAKVWLDKVTDRILASFLPSVSPFYSSAMQVYGDLASFGNACQYDEVVPEENKIMDVALSLSEVCYDIDAFGQVVEVVRKFLLTPAQALGRFRKSGDYLPEKLRDLAVKGDQGKITFFQHIQKNEGWRKGMLGPKGKRWSSIITCECDRALVRVAGYNDMPFDCPRWDVDTGQIYGMGQAYIALASARTHNRMQDATIRAAQRAADPTLLAPDRGDWPLNGKIRPGEVVYGAVDMQGRALLRPLDTVGAVNLTLQEKQSLMEEIKDAFHYSLMSLHGRTGMTATEIMTVNEERQRLWAPHSGRIQEEYLATKIARRFAMLWIAGQLPPPPQGMEGAELQVDYQSAAAAAQRSVEGNATLRLIQDVAPLMQMKPRLADRISEDDLLEVLADARGAPGRIFRSREDADALQQQREQQQQAMQMAQMAQAAGGVMKDGAQAQAAMAQAEAAAQGAPA